MLLREVKRGDNKNNKKMRSAMESKRKETFTRSILSSAVLAAITSFSSTAQASACPSPDPAGNILVVSGDNTMDTFMQQ